MHPLGRSDQNKVGVSAESSLEPPTVEWRSEVELILT